MMISKQALVLSESTSYRPDDPPSPFPAMLLDTAASQHLPYSPRIFVFAAKPINILGMLASSVLGACLGCYAFHIVFHIPLGRVFLPIPLLSLALFIGVLFGLASYFAARQARIRNGMLDEFSTIHDALATGNLAVLIAALSDKREALRLAACRALFEFGEAAVPAIPALLDTLWGEVPSTGWTPSLLLNQKKCCIACGTKFNLWNQSFIEDRLCHKCMRRAAETIEDILPSRGWAARILGVIGSTAAHALPALQAVAEFDPAENVRREASQAIRRIKRSCRMADLNR